MHHYYIYLCITNNYSRIHVWLGSCFHIRTQLLHARLGLKCIYFHYIRIKEVAIHITEIPEPASNHLHTRKEMLIMNETSQSGCVAFSCCPWKSALFLLPHNKQTVWIRVREKDKKWTDATRICIQLYISSLAKRNFLK